MQTNRRTEVGCTSISKLMNYAISNFIAHSPQSLSQYNCNKDIPSFLRNKENHIREIICNTY